MPPPFDLEAHLRRHGAALRALARQLLRDDDAADDAVQEVWLSALRSPPPHDGSPAGWLRTALQNVARRLRRGEERRLRRETAAARAEPVPGAANVVAREEIVQRLVAAVAALESPYREAIWQRWFEERPPREIAARTGVPLATVKSRLQRGLALLRDRLAADARDGENDWRPALATALALGTTTIGGLMTLTTTKVAAAAAVAIALAVALWTARPDPALEPVREQPVADIAPEAAAAPREAPVIEPRRAAAQRNAVAANETAPAPEPAVLRGRVVDPAGSPLAGSVVELTGRANGQDRLASWVAEHGSAPVFSAPPPQTTREDGAFSLAFAPSPPFSFTLSIRSEGRPELTNTWVEVQPGQIVELGDVVAGNGIALRGRVVDEHDRAVADAEVRLQALLLGGTAPMRPQSSARTRTGPDGSFALDRPLPPAPHYMVTVEGFELAEPRAYALAAEPAEQSITVVVRPAAAVVAIEGVVVDDHGEPVDGAWLRVENATHVVASSGRTGRFRIQLPRELAREPVHVEARRHLLEPFRSAPLRWGQRDVELRMQRGASVTVRLTGTDGAPVMSYAVRLLPLSLPFGSSDFGRVVVRGPFADGTATLPSVPVGDHLLWLELPSSSAVREVTARLAMADRQPRHLEVRVSAATRTLRVVDAAGTPVAGSTVRLVDPVVGELKARTPILPLARFAGTSSSHGRAVLVQDIATGADGTATLHGPADRALAVLVEGDGHLPCTVADVRLDDPAELRVVVARGGRLTGRIEPPAALAELARLAGAVPQGTGSPAARMTDDRAPPIATLVVAGPDARRPRAIPIDAEGRFAADRLPPGTWGTTVSQGMRLSMRGPEVTIGEGEASEVVVDLAHLLPGTLRGLVLHNGAPLADQPVQLAFGAAPEDPRRGGGSFDVRTDAEGRFELRGPPGEYELRRGPPLQHGSLRAATTATVRRDAVTQHVFAIDSGRLVVRLVGAPRHLHDMWLGVVVPSVTGGTGLVRDGATERFEAEVPTGDYELIASRAGRQSLSSGGMIEPLRVTLGRVRVERGGTTTVQFAFPDELLR